MPVNEPGDGELVARVKAGDRDAFGALCERYYRMVSVLCYQKARNWADVEDLVQESFVRAYRALDSLREADKFAGWLAQIAVKICLDHLRKRDRHDPMVQLEAANAVPSSGEPRTIAVLEAREEHEKIAAAIGSLPDKYRLVVTLRFLEKRSYREIALQLGEPDGTIANRIHRAVKMLQDALNGASATSQAEETES